MIRHPSHKDFDFAVFDFNKASKVSVGQLADTKIKELSKNRHSVNSVHNRRGLKNSRKHELSQDDQYSRRLKLDDKENRNLSRPKTKIRLRTMCN